MTEQFKEWHDRRHDYAREWKKKTGGKVLGYFCTYVPEEILYAAGVLPVRILGSHEPQNHTDAHIFSMYCPFCRDCLAQGLKGRYDYLDGIMIAQSCLHIRQAYTSWDLHLPREFSYYLPMPHNVQSRHAVAFLIEEYKRLINGIERWSGGKISDADLRRGIEIMNRSRSAMKSIYEARKAADAPFTGLESMYMVVSSQLVDKNEHAAAVEKTLAREGGRSAGTAGSTRLMLVGSENDDTELIGMVESLGALVVQDDHCTGSRYFWDLVENGDDPLASIARRSTDRLPCPSKDWPGRRRAARIVEFAKGWRAAGAIVVQQKSCTSHAADIPAIQKALEAEGVPSLVLESDVTVPVGQLRVRVEAFLEMLSDEGLFS
jgi:benzoyl-CoA reductase subunit C